MAIDARVRSVYFRQDGSGQLNLIDRPGGGIAGQTVLYFKTAPEEVTALNGRDIWGGASSIMLGTVEIAKRASYLEIVFNDRETFVRAIVEHNKRRERH